MRKKGILLTNLGTPNAPTPKAVRRYLKEFLSDRRVVELPALLWQPILNGFILPFRPKKTARNYKSIWWDEGSPLKVISQRQAEALQAHFLAEDEDIIVDYGMRYGEPSIESALTRLQAQGVEDLTILPLFPQFSAATTSSTLDCVYKVISKWKRIPSLRFHNHYAEHPAYIQALCDSINAHWQQHGKGELLLMSFHGLPQKTVDAGDPYQDLCYRTARCVAKRLGLEDDAYLVTFQSRFGPATWLQPYTDKTLENLPKQAIRNIDVICPGFSADCLETLEEMAIENRAIFLEAGGEQYRYIPALNESPAHIRFMAEMAARKTQTADIS